MLWTTTLVGLVLLLASPSLVDCTHFRGGSITWEWVSGTTVTFHTSLGWTYKDGNGCTKKKKLGKLQSPPYIWYTWDCVQGCSSPASSSSLSATDLVCVAFSKKDDYELGEYSFNYTFPDNGPFTITFESYGWMALSTPNTGNARWRVGTTVDLNVRSDVGTPNSAPKVMSEAIYYKQFECNHTIKIPVSDRDGDTVRCRWGVGYECDPICGALPNATLDEETCTIKFDAFPSRSYIAGGDYAVAIIVEDFPQQPITMGNKTINTTTPMSNSTVQFMIHTPKLSTPCDSKPRFVPDTPGEGATVWFVAGIPKSFSAFADNGNMTNVTVKDIIFRGPLSISAGPLADYQSLTNTKFRNFTWTPTRADKGTYIACLTAINDQDAKSEARCFTITVEVDYCVPFPCKNGGTCVNLLDDFYCYCVQGYTAKNCGIEIDECKPKPCLNGGTCYDLLADFECDCLDTFSGKKCQLTYDFCNTNPCLNGGECRSDIELGFVCDCINGWSGRRCDWRKWEK